MVITTIESRNFPNFDRKCKICEQISWGKFVDFCCNDIDTKSHLGFLFGWFISREKAFQPFRHSIIIILSHSDSDIEALRLQWYSIHPTLAQQISLGVSRISLRSNRTRRRRIELANGLSPNPYYKQKEITNRFVAEMLSLFLLVFSLELWGSLSLTVMNLLCKCYDMIALLTTTWRSQS